MKKLKVFFGTNESGVAWWRGKQPGYKLIEKDLCDVEIFSVYDTDPTKADELVGNADVIYCPSPTGIDSVVQYLKYYQTGKATVSDYDDNLFECHPFNPGYKTLGLKPAKVKLPDGTERWLWEDQKKGFSVKDNMMRFQSQLDLLHISTLITTTTSVLKNTLNKNSNRHPGDIRIVPNAIDFELFKPMTRTHGTDKLRIGWTASDSHLLEGVFIRGLLGKLYKERPNDFQFVILGNVIELRDALKQFPIEWHDFIQIDLYPLKLASLDMDIGICPLENTNFNKSKSALKWSEYSSLCIPSVCTDMEPYSVVQDNKTGMLAKSIEDFADKLYTLMDSPKLRADIANNAYQYNYENYDLGTVVYDWMKVFDEAYDKRYSRSIKYKGEVIQQNGRK